MPQYVVNITDAIDIVVDWKTNRINEERSSRNQPALTKQQVFQQATVNAWMSLAEDRRRWRANKRQSNYDSATPAAQATVDAALGVND